MSEKSIGRFENAQAGAAQTSMAQECWNANSMRDMTSKQQSAQIPSDFGQFLLSDNSQTLSSDAQSHKLHTAGITEKVQIPMQAAPDNSDARQHLRQRLHAGADQQHHSQLTGTASDKSHAHHDSKPAAHKHKPAYLVGSADIEATHDQQMKNHAAETIQAHMPAKMYKTGQHYPMISVPNEPGKENYYNGLKDAYFKNNTLYGTPVHIDGNMVTPLDHGVAIKLHSSEK